MKNYNTSFNLEVIVSNTLWFVFIFQAKIQLFLQKINNKFTPVINNFYHYFNKANYDCFPNRRQEVSDIKFITTTLSFKTNDNTEYKHDIKLLETDYYVNNKLFTLPWIYNWLQKNSLQSTDCIDVDSIQIVIIDNNVNLITLNKDKYIIIEKNNYIVKTI